MSDQQRVRLVFEDRHLLSKAQRSEGLRRCWLILESHLATMSELASYIVRTFELRCSCPDDILLSMDGFVLPIFESTRIVKDKDIISVKRKGGSSTKVVYRGDGLHGIEDNEVVEKLPIASCSMLTIEEDQEKSTAYRRKNKESACQLLEKCISMEAPLIEVAHSKRKREHSDRLLPSRRKKLKETNLESPKDTTIEVDTAHEVQRQLSSEKHGNDHNQLRQADRLSPGDDKLRCEGSGEDMVDSVSFEDRKNQAEDNGQKIESPAKEGTIKIPSRSARRKKAKRKWHREQANSQANSQNLQYAQMVSADDMHETDQHIEQQETSYDQQDADLNIEQQETDQHIERQQEDLGADMDGEIVPFVVRPGHIRFEPIDGEESARQSDRQMETVVWKGTTNKRKGQKCWREKTRCSRSDDDVPSGEWNERISVHEGDLVDNPVVFEELTALTGPPKEGDLIAYRLVELSSSWCPELCSFRVGKVMSYDPASGTVILAPVPKYPIFSGEKEVGEDLEQQPDVSLYREDGTLEIDFPSLVDVRILELKKIESEKETKTARDGTNRQRASVSNSIIVSDKKGDMGWNEIQTALEEKKMQLLKGCTQAGTKDTTSSNGSWSLKALRGSALGPTMAFLRATNDLQDFVPE